MKRDKIYALFFRMFFGIFFLLGFYKCKSSVRTSPQEIVERSVAYHGGMELWKASKGLSFDKEIILYDREGAIESKLVQHQKFRYDRGLEGELSWVKNGNRLSIVYKDKVVLKKMNDSIITSKKELQAAKRTFFSAHYVINQPFKLLDSLTKLSYVGIKMIEGKENYVVQVGYKNDTDLSDKWFYYFDSKTCQLIAAKVVHGAKTSMIKNLTFDKSTGLLFNKRRKSYFIKSSGEIDYLRAAYFYTNFRRY
ncbi:MAG: hypothetical protein P8K77_07480 [Polaribacter sp.]|nr:hypothetical protein [Polaribacter sp.]